MKATAGADNLKVGLPEVLRVTDEINALVGVDS